jgi:hypothetical protein
VTFAVAARSAPISIWNAKHRNLFAGPTLPLVGVKAEKDKPAPFTNVTTDVFRQR